MITTEQKLSEAAEELHKELRDAMKCHFEEGTDVKNDRMI